MVIPDGERMAVVETKLEGVNTTLNHLVTKFDNFSVSVATQAELKATQERVTKLESRNLVKSTLVWVTLVASVILNIIAVYTMFRG